MKIFMIVYSTFFLVWAAVGAFISSNILYKTVYLICVGVDIVCLAYWMQRKNV